MRRTMITRRSGTWTSRPRCDRVRESHDLDELRPAAALMLGGFASTLDQPVLIASYAYLGALQLCIFFASLFLLRNVVALSNGLSLFLALGVTVGFFLQYAFDVNAWSGLASLSVDHALCRASDIGSCNQWPGPKRTRRHGASSAMPGFSARCSSAWPGFGTSIRRFGAWSWPSVPRSCCTSFSFPKTVPIFSAGCSWLSWRPGGAIALCTFAWPMTVGFILRQTAAVQDPSRFAESAAWFPTLSFRI